MSLKVTAQSPVQRPHQSLSKSPNLLSHCHRNLHLMGEAWEGFQTAAAILFAPPWLLCFDHTWCQGKIKRPTCRAQPWSVFAKLYSEGRRQRRLEEKKSSNRVMSELWTTEAVSCPTKLYCTTCTPNIHHWPQSLYLQLWLRIISLQNSPLKMQSVPQTAAAETIFQRRIYQNFSLLAQKNLYGRWKKNPEWQFLSC